VATALQMITWGVQVNEFGNAYLDEKGEFVKVPDQGVTDEMWAEMAAYAKSKNLKAGDYKKLNLPFENKLLGLPREIRERMAKGVEEFVYELLTEVFNAKDTAPLAIEAILKAGSYDIGPKAKRIDNLSDWTEQKVKERAAKLHGGKGPKGNFDD
jgi:fructose-bisphosphate aldolase class II